jgi:hypothetical protein
LVSFPVPSQRDLSHSWFGRRVQALPSFAPTALALPFMVDEAHQLIDAGLDVAIV